MKRLLVAVALTAGAVPGLGAQDSTAALLRQAHAFYEQLEVERALPLLRQVVSPSWSFPVEPAQRVDAYKYLGACLALAGKRDSAVLYFRAAVERDPFTDLDPAVFTPAQLATFAEARRRTFAVAARPVAAARVDPRTDRVSFTVVATHPAAVELSLRLVGEGAQLRVLQATIDGVREVPWNGLLADRRLAPPGRYELTLIGRSQLSGTRDSTRVFFDLRHELEPLEDTLPDLDSGALLPEQIPPSAARVDLPGGLGVAAATLLLAGMANADLHGDLKAGAGVVAGAAAATAIVSAIVHRRHRAIPENVAANERRRGERLATNQAIRRRNAERIAATVLVVSPAAGAGPPP